MKTVIIETLEGRRLLSVSVNINFQPAGATVPAGYLVDSGQTFASRGNGFSYGWNVNNTASTRDKNSALSADQRYDTLIHLQKSPVTNGIWEIALPNDTYRVRLVSGDAQYFDSVFRTNVEGTLALNATPTSGNRWVEGTVTVVVTDGRLTIQSVSGAVNNKLNFIDIASVTPDPDPDPTPSTFIPARINFQPAGATIPVGYLADTGLVFGSRGNGYSYGWNASNTAQTRDKNSPLSLDQRYDTLTHLQKSGNPNAVWEMAVPNGTYWVRVVSGDAANFDGVFKTDVEGTLAVNGTPTSARRWVEGNVQVTVNDGRLTVKSAAGAVNNKISFLEVIPTATNKAQLLTQIDKTIAWAQSQFTASLNSINNNVNVYLERTRDDGTWQTRGASHWVSGYMSGVMWQLYYNTGNTAWKDKATAWALPLAGQATQDDDTAFRMWPSFKPLLDETGNAQYRQVLINAANEKMAHWNNTVGAFETSWYTDSIYPNADFAVLTDVMNDLELLYWATSVTGNQSYAQRATQHMEKLIQDSLRPDGTFFQLAMYNSTTGQFVGNDVYHGYGINSHWSRGQAWAIFALPDVIAATGRQDFLQVNKNLADWFIDHLPADGVPVWDWDDPAQPNAYRDSSAAAIAAVGFLKLADYLGKDGAGAKYYTAAERMLTSLTSAAYLTEGTVHKGIITHGVAIKTRLTESNDASLSFGDYYLLEAITRYKATL
jgi:unsaturated chondroitin disaccharide hydrolase